MNNQKLFLLRCLFTLLGMSDILGQDVQELIPGPALSHQMEVWLISGNYSQAFEIFDELQVAEFEEEELQFWQLICLANFSLNLEELVEGAEFLFQAKAKMEEAGISSAQAQFGLHNLLGHYYMVQREMAKALQSNEIALRISLDSIGRDSKEAANTYNNYGTAMEMVRDYAKALDYHHQARMIWHQKDTSEVYIRHAIRTNWLNLGTTHYELMKADSAEYYLQQALVSSQQEPRVSLGILARSYNNLAVLYLGIGRFQEAEDYAKKAIEEAENLIDGLNPFIGTLYNNLGDIYLLTERYEEAISTELIAIDHKQAGASPDHLSIFETYYTIGKLFFRSSEYDAALPYFNKVLDRMENPTPEGSKLKGVALQGLGNTLVQLGKLEEGEAYLRQAIELNEVVDVETANFLGGKYSSLGECLARQGRYLEAEELFRLAIMAHVPSLSKEQHPEDIDITTVFEPVELFLTLNELALVQQRAYHPQLAAVVDLKKSLATYQLSDRLIGELRTYLTQPENQREILKQFRVTYQGAQAVSLQLYERTGEAAYLEMMYAFREKLAASTLLAGIRAARIRKVANVPDSLLTEEANLVRQIAYWERVGDKEAATGQLALLRQQQLQLWRLLQMEYPDYYQLTQNFSVAPISAVQQELRGSGKVVLQLSWQEAEILALAIHETGTQLFRIPKNQQALQDLNYLIAACQQPNQSAPEFAEAAFRWYERLIAAVRERFPLESLVVIPDDRLHFLPLECLIVEKPAEDIRNFDQLADLYLVQQVPISYAYSATLWAEENSAGTSGQSKPFWFVSTEISESAARTSLGHEAREIGRLFPLKMVWGKEATEQNLQQNGREIGILHLSVHGSFNEQDPMGSFVQLNPDSMDDGKLQAWEVYQLELPAQLTVLAACETGTGELAPGEGLMSLARAFTFAGCPSLVSTLWKAESETIAPILLPFYQALKAGQTKSEALQQAKISYLEGTDSRYQKEPYFWAGYVLIGNDRPLASSAWWISWKGGIVALVLLMGGIFWVRKRR